MSGAKIPIPRGLKRWGHDFPPKRKTPGNKIKKEKRREEGKGKRRGNIQENESRKGKKGGREGGRKGRIVGGSKGYHIDSYVLVYVKVRFNPLRSHLFPAFYPPHSRQRRVSHPPPPNKSFLSSG